MIVEKKSSFTFLVHELNKMLDEEYKFELDKVINMDGEFVCYKDSVINDTKIYPNPLCQYNKYYKSVGKWINRRLFTEILQMLCNGKLMMVNTTLIRMQIGINMAIKQIPEKDEQDEWRKHILDVSYARFYAINLYYSKVICELPF